MEKMSKENAKNTLFDILKDEILDEKVLNALKEVPREEFMPKEKRSYAYIDAPFSIGYDQTISQPSLVAFMVELLRLEKNNKVLDIGTGSGYQAAILSKLCREVISIERIPQLYVQARKRLRDLKYDNITCVLGNGVHGYQEEAPYDKIICAAAYDEIPGTWVEQLVEGGIIVVPIRMDREQVLISAKKKNDSLTINQHVYVRFVDLVDD